MPPKAPKAPKQRPAGGHRPTTQRLHRLWPGIHVLRRGLSPATRTRRPMRSPVVQLVVPGPPPPMFQPQGNIDDLDIGAPAFGPATALPAYFESNAGGYVNFHPRSGEEERHAELQRERERRMRRRRNGGMGAERRRWVWRNGKGGKGKRRERRRDENGRFV